MATYGHTFTSGDTVTPTKLNNARTVSDIVNADIKSDAAIALSKLATGALPTAITVASANLVDGTIVNADINASAAIAGSKLADGGITAAKLDGAQTGSAPIYGCRAWLRFSGTGTPSIVGSGNIASVTRNGSSATGLYNVTFTTAMPSDAYSVVVSAVNAGSAGIAWADSITTTGFRVACFNTSNELVDCNPVSVAVFV